MHIPIKQEFCFCSGGLDNSEQSSDWESLSKKEYNLKTTLPEGNEKVKKRMKNS